MTKQAASELVSELEAKGYVRREPDHRDGRAKLVVMTDRGWAATRAATEAGAAAAQPWIERLGPARTAALLDGLRAAGGRGRLRPVW